MPCSSCKDVILLDPDESGLDYTTSVSVVRGVDNKEYSIQSCLVMSPHRPKRGWRLEFNINGQQASVTGNSGKEAVYQAEQLFKINNVPFTPLNLWFNANIQWIQRCFERNQRVKLSALLEVADAHAKPEQGLHEKPQYPASEWASSALGVVALYLATENYEYGKFLYLIEELRSWMNPQENVLMGSSESYIKITLRVTDLKRVPLYKQEEARQWLVETQNYMGITNTTYEEAKKLYHWN